MRKAALFLALVFAAGCGTTTDPTPPQWQTTLQGVAVPAVTGTAVATSTANQTTVTANISGAPAGGTHPWHIHAGTCGSGGPIVGEANAYPPLRPAAGGQANATATLNVALQANQPYYVNVHQSPENLQTIVACGNLTLR